jgi:hypothetical protein
MPPLLSKGGNAGSNTAVNGSACCVLVLTLAAIARGESALNAAKMPVVVKKFRRSIGFGVLGDRLIINFLVIDVRLK